MSINFQPILVEVSRSAAGTMRGNEKVSSEKVAQCETRAHRIVERFLDPVTDEAEFLSQVSTKFLLLEFERPVPQHFHLMLNNTTMA